MDLRKLSFSCLADIAGLRESESGAKSGWQLVYPGDTKRRGAAPSDTVSAGSRVWVPERRAYTIATLLTPIGSAVAVIVSVLALTR